jgi:hypothetical protein
MKKITVKDIELITGFELSPECKQMINDFNLEYQELTSQERDKVILDIINHLNINLVEAGKHRLEQWEKGWYENFELLKQGQSVVNLVPKYFGKYSVVRWKGDFVKSDIKDFDYKQLLILMDAHLHEYVGNKYDNLFEFGCGPAYHLLRFNNFNKNINMVGLDWTKASQNIINEINQLGINNKIQGYNFDFFNPDYNLEIPENSAIFTCSALEQMGENYKEFIDFLLAKKPDLCINFEPCTELLDENSLVDKLSILYSKKRNYLKGYVSYLEKLEQEGKIKILLKKRLYGGSLYLEGYPIVIWKINK